ncbi:hypothetical protein Tco_0143435 [Tanacetum coccineum]
MDNLFPRMYCRKQERSKVSKSQQLGAENGLPILKYVLLPKTRGFHACVEILKGSLDADSEETLNLIRKRTRERPLALNDNTESLKLSQS